MWAGHPGRRQGPVRCRPPLALADRLRAVLLPAGLCVGLTVGSQQGLAGAVLGAGAGFRSGHLVAVGLTMSEQVVHGIGRW
jgi:hypothetical protein